MRRVLLILLSIIIAIPVLLALAVGGLWVALNTQGGRAFVVREVNRFAGPMVKIDGLGGHFPADLRLADVQVADADGMWLHGTGLELRWLPLRLLHGEAHVQDLSAQEIDVLRAPAPGGKSSSGSSGNFSLPLRVTLDRLDIGALTLGPSLAGQALALHVQGSGYFHAEDEAGVTLNATTPDGAAQYQLAATLAARDVELKLHVVEPEGGFVGHFAGPQAQGAVRVDINLAGPRDNATLNFALALGAAQLQGHGNLGLEAPHQFADVTAIVPELAPIGALAGTAMAGSTQLHFHLAQGENGAATLALDGFVALTQAPAGLQNFLGPRDEISLQASLLNSILTIEKLHLSGADFALALDGKASEKSIALNTDADIDQLTPLAPELTGNVAESGMLSGSLQDLAVQARLTGTAGAKGQPSGPFDIELNVQHLPHAPTGTLTGTGMLANSPLALDAAFLKTPDGGFQVTIHKTQWRSVKAVADLHLAPGAMLPIGTANFSAASLRDFRPFVPPDVSGSVEGDFASAPGETVRLNLTARNLLVSPQLGAINGTINASGPVQALGFRTQLSVAGLLGHPAQLSGAGTLDAMGRRGQLSSFNASWRSLTARLQGPVAIETQPAIAVRHLQLALNGGSVTLDGVVSPTLNARAAVRNLPLDVANIFVPSLGAVGTLSADATLTGPLTAPRGPVHLNVTGLHVASGNAAALPPANISGSAQLAGTSVQQLNVHLQTGPQIQFTLSGQAPLAMSAPMNLQAQGQVDLALLNLVLAAQGTAVHGKIRANLRLTGTAQAPTASGNVTLSGGSVQNIGSGLNLTDIGANVQAAGQNIALQHLTATAGHGRITGHGTISLAGNMPVNLRINANNASPISSDMISETLNGDVTLHGALRGALTLGGNIVIASADINIPRGLPPSVANLPIINEGEKPPPPPSPPPPIALALDVRAKNRIFIRGDGLFAELGGHLRLGGTLAAPDPEGHFDLIRGNFNLAGRSLQFTSGNIGFNGGGFIPSLDLVASASSATVSDASLTVGGTAAKPTITLSSTPPLPSDEILAQLLFGTGASSLTPFQAASLAAALAQISGVGGGFNPLDKIRSTLGLDQLSLGGTGSGPPTLQAGRYVAPGVYVGATQASNGQGTQVNVQINLYRGLKLTTSTGTSSTGGDSDSVGLTYQFNY
jgi:translocation and assembly module TamB